MNGVLKVAASMSLSGALVVLVLLAVKPLLRGRFSQRWHYYIWLVALARLLVPFAPEENLTGTLFRMADAPPAQVQVVSLPEAPNVPLPAASSEPVEVSQPTFQQAATMVVENLWLLWLTVALALLVRKATAYQSYIRYLRAGGQTVDDPAVLDTLAALGEQAGVKRPVELLVCPLAASPVLIGGLRPCIVLPTLELPAEELRCTLLHELAHCRRWDGAYKWLVQLVVCLHWYNPAVHLMARETARDCELACDEAVLALLPEAERRTYGDTLLHAFGAGGALPGGAASVTLCEDGARLKERLGSIMKFKKHTKRTAALSLALAGVLLAGATAAGAYTGPTKKPTAKPAATDQAAPVVYDSSADEVRTAYDLGSLPRFGRAFARLTGAEQETWLEKIYDDGKIAFFSVGLNNLNSTQPLSGLAEVAYADGNISFFSVLANELDEEELEDWLERAEEDRRSSFQMVLLDALDRDFEMEALEAELEKEQDAAYAAVGVTKKGKDRYYKGELVNIFLDQQGKSYYVLDMNPEGKVNVKIVRDEAGDITGVAYMTEAERERLFGKIQPDGEDDCDDWDDDWEDWDDEDCDSGKTVVAVEAERIKAGSYLWLGTFYMKEGDHVRYEITAEGGERLRIGFAKPGKTKPGKADPTYYTVSKRCKDGLELDAFVTWREDEVEPGNYRLFIYAEDGDLKDVEGSVIFDSAEK